jgi:hypothetical protein
LVTDSLHRRYDVARIVKGSRPKSLAQGNAKA